MKRDYGRTTITVPWDLKERMKKARAHVNWSSVACEAFEKKLEELGPIEEITSVEDALKRMKSVSENASKTSDTSSESGHVAGVKWAMNLAQPNQLKRIELLRNEYSESDWEELMTSRDGWRELGKCIDPGPEPRHPGEGPRPKRGPESHHDGEFDDIPNRPRRRRRGPMGFDHDRSPKSEREIWRSILDQRPDHPGFFLSFATGALGIWDQIKDQF